MHWQWQLYRPLNLAKLSTTETIIEVHKDIGKIGKFISPIESGDLATTTAMEDARREAAIVNRHLTMRS